MEKFGKNFSSTTECHIITHRHRPRVGNLQGTAGHIARMIFSAGHIQGCELDRFLTEFKRYLQVRVRVL